MAGLHRWHRLEQRAGTHHSGRFAKGLHHGQVRVEQVQLLGRHLRGETGTFNASIAGELVKLSSHMKPTRPARVT
ncbi:hypothetical protein GCM10022267_88420 [Lentzea roselyniae]|uniref:Uncharacterized protein n=1 Tax=Lentzea roselyniae TaxID=531940 RepID=A0ABP7CHH3_9PSEU